MRATRGAPVFLACWIDYWELRQQIVGTILLAVQTTLGGDETWNTSGKLRAVSSPGCNEAPPQTDK
jgi:hypothetical protein